ncbi:S1C family serine protease [Novosphingobium lentum]|uniref:S1C family serine protease n=1 Tax=Novosphingobium lentum TaxID=145287 RepID=UPI00082D417D|nr:serine protease [Novosphingobium lentum]
MTVRLRLAFAALFALLCGGWVAPALADPTDISAAARGVVRVVIVQNDGSNVSLIGHGSGFAVAPNLVVTNAHVVEELRNDDTLMVGVVPPEGKSGVVAHLIAFSPGNDLALLRLDGKATVPFVTLNPAPVEDGSEVYAVGYPGNVDMAQGLSLSDLVDPQAPVKTRGMVSAGRSSRSFDTLLHTAPIGAGNSGGPLLDSCGRVVGVNSFGTVSQNGTDSSFFFAISMRELGSFLRQSQVTAHVSSQPCRSIADFDRAEGERSAGDAARATAAAQAKAQADQHTADLARREAEIDILAERDNGLALAALLLVATLAAGGSALLFEQRDQRRKSRIAAALAAALLLGSLVAWFSRPSLAQIDERADNALAEATKGKASASATGSGPAGSESAAASANAEPAGTGAMRCIFQPDRSRVTVSEITDVPLDFEAGGCVNKRTQYSLGSSGWSRVLVPRQDLSVSLNTYDPATRTYKVEHFLLGLAAMDKLRATRDRFTAPQCGAGEAAARKLDQNEAALRQLLPPEPNERLTYHCDAAAKP